MSQDDVVNTTLSPQGWDRVILATNDRIFPLDNLKAAWAENPRVRLIDEPHLPNFQQLIEQEIVDKKLIASKFRKSITTYDDNAIVQHEIARRLWDICRKHISEPPLSLLEIGYGTGLLTKEYISEWHPYRLSLWDLVPTKITLPSSGEIIAGDAEELIRLIPDGYFEAILSASSIQWFNNLPAFFRHASRVLTPGGHMAISTFGIDNLKEVAEVTQLPLRYFSIAELKAMLPDDCEIITVEEQHTTLKFSSVREVMLHLRNTGVNALRHATSSPSEFMRSYPHDDSGASLTYNPIYMLIKKKGQ
jgi:malonyl-ACP O-methyltransferase BioC